jgi:hypothetical protein
MVKLKIVKNYLLTARTTRVLLLLRSLGPEEETLGTTLHAVHVIIEVEETNSEHGSANTSLVNLTVHPVVSKDETDENELDKGDRGELGHHKAMLNSLDIISGFGSVLFHTLSAVSGHFYFILRK